MITWIRLRRGATVAFTVDAVDAVAVEDVANVNENNLDNGAVAAEGAALPLMSLPAKDSSNRT